MTVHALPARQGGPIAGLRNCAWLAWRSLVQIKHNPMELMDMSVQPVMFLLLFVFVFGGQMAGSPGEYLQYALGGLIVQNSLFTALNTAVGLNGDIRKGVFDRFRSLPIARSAPLVGRIAADLAKQVWAIALMLVLGLAIGFDLKGGVGGALAVFALLLLFTLAMSWMTVLLGIVAGSEEKVQMLGFVLVMPLTFTSSAFVRADTFPAPLQWWSRVNPVTAIADASRDLLNGHVHSGPILTTLAWAAGIAVVFFPLAMRAYRSKLS
ncbi:MAG TPA: ABC transporter permease [Stackebrandtia sp.]|jgi:ABC-2 type transport system permease protein/oleandomycin transport system permease protein|uniref:ABC transporter permease n=1 Tax=Stackebrandtia sp. TaxID=2023065 RepID=UPI002D3BD113|nr:ABC transporter permease [Stackebrandtia sp.]HZE41810.1 ABC transporter permease [Stackebrandtia sp.]